MSRDLNPCPGREVYGYLNLLKPAVPPAEPAAWGTINSARQGDMIDLVYVRCCYGQTACSSPHMEWVVCGQLEFDPVNLRMKSRRENGGGHSHAADALVLVRITDENGYPLCSCTVLGVRPKDAAEGDQFAVRVAPNARGLFQSIQDWACGQYGTPDSTAPADPTLMVTYELGGEAG